MMLGFDMKDFKSAEEIAFTVVVLTAFWGKDFFLGPVKLNWAHDAVNVFRPVALDCLLLLIHRIFSAFAGGGRSGLSRGQS